VGGMAAGIDDDAFHAVEVSLSCRHMVLVERHVGSGRGCGRKCRCGDRAMICMKMDLK
jgi:hypothetical protein